MKSQRALLKDLLIIKVLLLIVFVLCVTSYLFVGVFAPNTLLSFSDEEVNDRLSHIQQYNDLDALKHFATTTVRIGAYASRDAMIMHRFILLVYLAIGAICAVIVWKLSRIKKYAVIIQRDLAGQESLEDNAESGANGGGEEIKRPENHADNE